MPCETWLTVLVIHDLFTKNKRKRARPPLGEVYNALQIPKRMLSLVLESAVSFIRKHLCCLGDYCNTHQAESELLEMFLNAVDKISYS